MATIGPGEAGAEPNAFRIERSVGLNAVMPVELAAEQAAEDLLALYTDSIERVQKALQELREVQQKAATALVAGRENSRLGPAAEDFQRVLEQLPDYIATAQAAAKEMRSLRSRVDRGQQRSKKLLHSIETGAPLVPGDLGAIAGAAVNGLGSLLASNLGWGNPAPSPAAAVVMEPVP